MTSPRSTITVRRMRLRLAWRNFLVATLLAAWLPLLFAEEGEHFVEQSGASKYAVILVGAAANQERAGQFRAWAMALRDSLRNDYGYAANNLRLLVGSADDDNVNIDGPCRAESIRAIFQSLAARVQAGDQFSVFLFGHGTGSGMTSKYNIVGPDLTGAEFGELLNSLGTQDIVVVNTTSASYGFSRALSANGRVIVSATRSSAEKYDTVFPGYFVEALQGHAADRDKNGRVSILEAFTYAKARVAKHFDQQGGLPSEHPTMDDNGDGVFSTNPDRRGDGSLAEIAYLDVTRATAAKLSPAAAKLHGRMAELERDIFLLRANKSALAESEYWAQLEPLLIELAKVTREFDAL